MDAARLPEVFELDGRTVRYFPAEHATEFSRLSPSARRSIPAIVRRVYAAAARHAGQDCLICGERAATRGQILIAVEAASGHDIGRVCADCATWGLRPDGRA